MLVVGVSCKLKSCINVHKYFIFTQNIIPFKYCKYELKKSVRMAQLNLKKIGNPDVLSPPENIRGLKILNRNLFNKDIKVPTINVGNLVVSKIMPHMKKYLLKMEHLKPIKETDNNEKYIMLNPMFVSEWTDIDSTDRENLYTLNITEKNFHLIDFTLSYDNWKADDLLKHILPEDNTSVAGFSKIGHIIHLNLKDHVLDYKDIIGEILHDKIAGCRTVVNKLDKIDNTYRNFQMEVLYGESDFLVQVKQNRCVFEFDFSTVYWNPRLATEHERIIKLLKPGDILYDVFAGVGPFAIPAAKKNCMVLANDLNPESYKWLIHNAKINKIKENELHMFNKDGRDFILDVLKMDLKTRLANDEKSDIFITMNLPGMATEFLNAFSGLFTPEEITYKDENINIVVHVYCFAKGEEPVKIARNLVETGLGHNLTDNLIEIFNVRTVSSFKEMMRVSFKLTKEILFNVNTKRKLDDHLLSEAKKCNDFYENHFTNILV